MTEQEIRVAERKRIAEYIRDHEHQLFVWVPDSERPSQVSHCDTFASAELIADTIESMLDVAPTPQPSRFRVELTATANVSASFVLETESAAAAEIMAKTLALEGNAEWEYNGCNDNSVEVVGVTEVS